jgi:hypothetical protein
MDPFSRYLLALHLAFAMPSSPPAIFTPPGVPSPSAPGAVHAAPNRSPGAIGAVHAAASPSPAVPGAVHAVPIPSPATPAVIHAPPMSGGSGTASLLVDPTGDNNSMLIEAMTPGSSGNALSFTIMWSNSIGTWAWMDGNEIWVQIGAKSRASIIGAVTGISGSRVVASDYYCSNDILINDHPYYERVADSGVRIVYNGAKWVVTVDGVPFYEQQIPYAYYPSGPWLRTTAGFIDGVSNISESLSVSTAQQVIDAINSTPETSAIVVASPVGDVTGGSWLFDLTPLASGTSSTPPAIHSAPAASPGTPPAIFTP